MKKKLVFILVVLFFGCGVRSTSYDAISYSRAIFINGVKCGINATIIEPDDPLGYCLRLLDEHI